MAMSPRVDWEDETSTNFPTEANSSEAITSTMRNPAAPSVLLTYKSVLIVVGVLGTFSNGFVLRGFWLARRSKITSSSIHIANHTTLDQSPFS